MSGTVPMPARPTRPVPSGRTPDDQVAGRSAVAVLLAVSQAACTISASTAGGRIRATASTSRRGSRASACTGKGRSSSGRTSGRSRCIATAYAGHAALRRVPLVRRRLLDVGNAQDARAGRDQHRPLAAFRSGAPTSAASSRQPEYTGELHVRWFQFGAFCPLFRAHGRTWHLRLPWGWNTGELGPTELAATPAARPIPIRASCTTRRVEPIVRKYLELRYRMLPYIYSAARECCRHRPADDARAVAALTPTIRRPWREATSFSGAATAGRAGRATRVRRRGASIFRDGTWFDFWTEETHRRRPRDRSQPSTSTMPLLRPRRRRFCRGAGQQYVDEPVEGPLTVVVYPGANGTFVLYEDDGATFEYRRGDWMRVAMTWTNAARTFRIQLAPGSRVRPSAARSIDVRIAGTRTMRRIEFSGQPVEVKL